MALITPVKKFYLSWTFWTGVLEILIAALGIVATWLEKGDFTTPSIILLVTGLLTILLRFKTTEPIL
jgi:hypothetical protein